MKRKFYGPLAFVCLLSIVSCKQERTAQDDAALDSVGVEDSYDDDSLYADEDELEELDLPEGRDEAFGDFMFAFLHNRRFQADRIKFPLPVTDGEGEHTITSGAAFRQDFHLPSYDSYTVLLGNRDQLEVFQNDLELADASIDRIDLASLSQRTFHFLRDNGRWQLCEERVEQVPGQLADFLGFYHRFTTDSIFQIESLAQPLAISTPDPDDELSVIEGTIDPSQWTAFCPEMPREVITNIQFGQHFENPHRIILVQCGMSNGLMDVYTFAKEGGRWKLVSFEN